MGAIPRRRASAVVGVAAAGAAEGAALLHRTLIMFWTQN